MSISLLLISKTANTGHYQVTSRVYRDLKKISLLNKTLMFAAFFLSKSYGAKTILRKYGFANVQIQKKN